MAKETVSITAGMDGMACTATRIGSVICAVRNCEGASGSQRIWNDKEQWEDDVGHAFSI